MSDPILVVDNLHFSYGGIRALKGINLEVHDKEIVTMIGANGAGKSTTLLSISGLIEGITKGEIYFMGQKINDMKPHDIAKLGIAQVLEGRHIFGNLTVAENLQMGAYLREDKEGIKNDLDYIYKLFPRLLERRSQGAKTLSGGEQQMLALGRALMQKPKLIMLDEPSLGLAPIIIDQIFEAISEIRNDRGLPVLLIEQNSNVALKTADRGYVIENGEVVLSDTAENLMNNELVKHSYLGV